MSNLTFIIKHPRNIETIEFVAPSYTLDMAGNYFKGAPCIRITYFEVVGDIRNRRNFVLIQKNTKTSKRQDELVPIDEYNQILCIIEDLLNLSIDELTNGNFRILTSLDDRHAAPC